MLENTVTTFYHILQTHYQAANILHQPSLRLDRYVGLRQLIVAAIMCVSAVIVWYGCWEHSGFWYVFSKVEVADGRIN
jgi:hypothetical protein